MLPEFALFRSCFGEGDRLNGRADSGVPYGTAARLSVEEERIAAPTREEAVLAGLRDPAPRPVETRADSTITLPSPYH
jgi:hypothetical protein